MTRHKAQIPHGDAHADAPPAVDHARFARDHVARTEHHKVLLDAVCALEIHIKD